MKKNIIFDLDNTLVHSDLAYQQALTELKVDDRIYQKARANVKSILTAKYFSTASRNRLLYFKEYVRLLQKPSSAIEILELYDQYEHHMLQCLALQIEKLDRRVLLQKLAQKADLFILTNENLKTQLAKITKLDPRGEFFKGILTSEEYGFEKPDQGIFEHLFKTYNLKPQDCVMVGDDYTNDIKPALALGMIAIQTTEFVADVKTTGHVIVNDLNKVLEFVECGFTLI